MSSADDGGPGSGVATGEPEDDEEELSEAEEERQFLVDFISGLLPGAVQEWRIDANDLWLRVHPAAWLAVGGACKESLDFDYFCFVSGIDWMPSTAPNPKAAVAPVEDGDDEDGEASSGATDEAAGDEAAGDEAAGDDQDGWRTGFAGGESRFQVLARLYSTTRKFGVTLKADLDEEHPRVDSWVGIYPGAEWHERETWEMFGFDFRGNTNLTHLYLPGGFEGFPLRKDFPLLSREVKPWPGLVDVEPMPEDPTAEDGAAPEGEPG